MQVSRTELTPLLFIERAAGVYAPRTAAVYGRRRFSYAELGVRVRRLATALRRAGLRPVRDYAYIPTRPPVVVEWRTPLDFIRGQ